MGQLDGKTALITGAGSGLGRAIARRFIAEGASVGVLERDAQRAAELGPALAVTLGDATLLADHERAVRATVERFGGLDVLVANAGVYDNRISLDEIPAGKIEEAFDELFAVDVKGYILAVKSALPELRRRKGAIVFTASISSFRAGYGGFLYVAAKHAVLGLTRQLAYELAPDVRVNAVAPGYVPTNLTGLASLGQQRTAGPGDAIRERLPLRLVTSADDVAAAYVLLASAGGRAMTGSVISVDAGAATQPG